jgi:HK97 family phage portal protein
LKLLGFHVPFTKQTDQNTVTPISDPVRIASRWGWITEAFGGMWQRNLVIDNTQSLLAFSAVYACLALISGDIAKLRFKLLQEQADETWQEIDSGAFSPVLRKPNRYQTRLQFIEQWMLSKLIWGNTYVLKERDERKVVVALYVLDPARVKILMAPDGSVFYQLSEDWLAGVGGAKLSMPASEIIHDRAKCLFHPLIGVPPLYACAASTTQGNKIQANSSRFFSNMSRPSGQLTAPGVIDEATSERMKRDFEAGFSGDNVGRLLVTGNGLKFEPFTMPADQSQLIEQLGWTVEDVARAYLTPLYKISASKDFKASPETDQEYYKTTLQPHIEAMELLLDEGLKLPADMMVQLDLDALLRMDPKARYAAYESGMSAGVLAPNEARLAENKPPKVGGDTPYLQQQNYSLAALAKRDAKADPFATGKTEAPAPAASTADEREAEEEMRALLRHITEGLTHAR